jgi:hypothetical protein
MSNTKCPSWLTLPSLLPGEDPTHLDDLVAAVWETIEPSNGVEQLMVGNLLQLLWGLRRFYRAEGELIRLNIPAALVDLLAPLTGEDKASEIAKQWQIGLPDAGRQVDQVLADTRSTMATVQAAALERKLNQISQIQRLMADLENRCDKLLSVVERRRAKPAKHMAGRSEEESGLEHPLSPKFEPSHG